MRELLVGGVCKSKGDADAVKGSYAKSFKLQYCPAMDSDDVLKSAYKNILSLSGSYEEVTEQMAMQRYLMHRRAALIKSHQELAEKLKWIETAADGGFKDGKACEPSDGGFSNFTDPSAKSTLQEVNKIRAAIATVYENYEYIHKLKKTKDFECSPTLNINCVNERPNDCNSCDERYNQEIAKIESQIKNIKTINPALYTSPLNHYFDPSSWVQSADRHLALGNLNDSQWKKLVGAPEGPKGNETLSPEDCNAWMSVMRKSYQELLEATSQALSKTNEYLTNKAMTCTHFGAANLALAPATLGLSAAPRPCSGITKAMEDKDIVNEIYVTSIPDMLGHCKKDIPDQRS